MTTKQLATYLITFIVVVAVMFGLVPPLLNAPSTFLNAIGAAVALSAFVASILVAHATFNHKE